MPDFSIVSSKTIGLTMEAGIDVFFNGASVCDWLLCDPAVTCNPNKLVSSLSDVITRKASIMSRKSFLIEAPIVFADPLHRSVLRGMRDVDVFGLS